MNTDSRFPHDRVVYFSDAVFAIAITLLVIEIKVPTHDQVHSLGMADSLRRLTPLFIGYVVSFLVTALFWTAHLELCRHIKVFDNKLVWLNIWKLLFVALMPFTTALYSENFGDNIAFSFYCLNLATIGTMSFWMHAYAVKKENLESLLGKQTAQWMKIRALIVPFVFLLCIPLTMLPSVLISRFGFVLIFIFQMIGAKFYNRRKAVEA